jgi:hypothetical protein
MGVARAIVAVILVAVAASPLVGGTFAGSSAAPVVYADSPSTTYVVTYGKPEKDKERKDKNREDEDDEDERGNRQQTEEERQKEKDQQSKDDDLPRNPTSALNTDNFQLEGQVISLNCDLAPKQIGIRTVDGEVMLYQGPRDTVNRIDRLYCGDLMVGDYIFVHEAQKRDEQNYDAFYISCQQEREEGDDNTNDNDDDVDPNCVHIWNR